MQISPQTIEPKSCSLAATDSVASDGEATKVTKRGDRSQQHFRWNAATTAAMVIVVVNLVTCATLRWSQVEMFGNINPVTWIAICVLMPSALICFSACRERNPSGRPVKPIERLGPYVLKGKLGAGGMGEVFLAEHQLMKRQCAVKLIHPRQARDRHMRESFEREAQATAQLTHWNTVEMYDYGTTDDGRFYYVMEYLKGMNLSQYVRQHGPMEPGRVIYILKQMCDALYEADCAGLVHRDIKPSNIFLTERGKSFDVVKLLDFGLVQATAQEPINLRSVDTKLHGSPAFMCPEQAVGMTPDSRGDLYSLGAVAYFLLTGHPPFVDENPIMLIVAHATTAVPTFEEIGVDVPRDLSDIILKCLSHEPSGRFASGRELLQALEQCSANTEWTWSAAEQWWLENVPTAEAPDQQSDSTLTDTLRMDRDTEPHLPARESIDFEEPTGIFELPAALARS